MPKKSSSKTPTQIQENPVVEQPKPSSTPKNFNSEIDEVVIGKKRKKAEHKKTDKEIENEVEQPKPTSTPKKFRSEIDEIFTGKKRMKAEQKKTDKENEKEAEKTKIINKNKKRKSKEDKEGRFTDLPARSRKKTRDGFNIYTEEELGINKASAGGTPLCPFDCDCCF